MLTFVVRLKPSGACSHSHRVATFAMDGTILDANAIFLQSMGYTLEEVRGKHHKLGAAAQDYSRKRKSLSSGDNCAMETHLNHSVHFYYEIPQGAHPH